LSLVLAGCAVTTQPLEPAERDRLGQDARDQLFAGQERFERPLTLEEATARAIKYHAEQRQRRMEEAAATAQLDVAQFDLLPRFVANAGYSTRNNEAFGFGVTPDGTITTVPSAAQEKTIRTGSVGVAWNLLDFGVSYYRAKQLSDQKLIAEERRRKALQILAHDVRVAWWRAEAAQRLMPQQHCAARCSTSRSRSRCTARSWRRRASSLPRWSIRRPAWRYASPRRRVKRATCPIWWQTSTSWRRSR
jgi:outer membrane protein TolC